MVNSNEFGSSTPIEVAGQKGDKGQGKGGKRSEKGKSQSGQTTEKGRPVVDPRKLTKGGKWV